MAASLEDGTIRRFVDIPESLSQWVEGAYGKRNFSQIVTLLITKFKDSHVHTPQQLAAIGAEEVRKLISDGEVEVGK